MGRFPELLNTVHCIFVLTLICNQVVTSSALQCNSCFTSCLLTENGSLHPTCECASPSECTGPACFSKVEIWSEDGIASVEMGCIDPMPSQGTGCYHASSTETINCFCNDRNHCNDKRGFHMFLPEPLPIVECCSCEPGLDQCPITSCKNMCQGNYCYYNYLTGIQGCASGYPEILRFLRTSEYSSFVKPPTCVTYVAQGFEPIVHGCSCAGDQCNTIANFDTPHTKAIGNFSGDATTEAQYSLQSQHKKQHYCYGLTVKNHMPIDSDFYKRSSTCQGHYCFVSLTSARIMLEGETINDGDYMDREQYDYDDNMIRAKRAKPIPRMEEYYELLAGCIRVDSKSKITVGCTVEYHSDPSSPLVKHCICEGHMCNYFNMISGEDMSDLYAYAGPRRQNENKPRIYTEDTQTLYSSNCHYNQLHCSVLIIVSAILYFQMFHWC